MLLRRSVRSITENIVVAQAHPPRLRWLGVRRRPTLEPIYGLVGLGLVHPDRVERNDRAKEGDVLILGKPLGVGILSAALKKGKLAAAGYAQIDRLRLPLDPVVPGR